MARDRSKKSNFQRSVRQSLIQDHGMKPARATTLTGMHKAYIYEMFEFGTTSHRVAFNIAQMVDGNKVARQGR